MKISELQPKMGNADVEAEVIEKTDAREFSKFGRTGRVANAIIQDSSGKVKLTLWNEQVDQVDVGDKVIIKNGYVSEWQGEIQLSTGRMGTLEIVKGASPPKAQKVQEEKEGDFEEEEIDD